jgi:O-antigen/teichoic acid export membrane protein
VGRLYRESADDHAVKRVAVAAIGLQLLNRRSTSFAMLMLRILTPQLAGRYYFAVAFIGYFDILVRFGLGTLLTREVAKDRGQANRYLSIVTVLRGLLWLASLPRHRHLGLPPVRPMTPSVVAAIALFALSLIFVTWPMAGSVFNASRKMEPAPSRR